MNYRGSLGYGEDTMNSLLGSIGQNDVEDCGELTLQALVKFSEVIDPHRIGVEGGSHGGFLSAWLVGHPKYKAIYQAACMRNPVLNMAFMVTATDIPDWIYACNQKKDFDFAKLSADDIAQFYTRSPQSVV
jgi:acylaminoacyl-peptidase